MTSDLRRRHARAHFKLALPALLALLSMLMLMVMGGGGPATTVFGARPEPQSPPSGQTGGAGAQQSDVLVLRVYFRNNVERDRLATELSAEEVATTDGYLTVLGTTQLLVRLQARGLRVEVDRQATNELRQVKWGNDPANPDTFYGGYYTVEEMQQFLDQMVTNYPDLAEKIDIGDSWCKTHPGQCTVPNSWNGYDLWVLHITNRNIPGPKPVFWYDAGIHSREIATPELAMNFIRWLLDGYNSNADARWLVDWHDIWVMPMLNPDGHHMVEAGGNNPYLQRKNGDRTYCTGWPPPGIGIDLNRNFTFLWACCGGSSGSPCSETYRGPSAGSEEETQAVMNKVRELIPDQRGPNINDPAPITTTGVYQNMHSNASLNLYPWGMSGYSNAPNHADLNNIGQHMSTTNADPPGNTYQSCRPPNCLYGVDGDAIDWAYGELGAAAFTTEVGGSNFFPSYSYTQNTLWPQNRGALIYQAKIARTPYLLARGPDTRMVVTDPMTTTQGTVVHLTGNINYNWSGNTYLQNVAAAEYYLDTPPWAGGTPVAMSAVDGNFDSPTENVEAYIDTSSVPVGTHLVMVRGRGVNSYEGYQSWGPISATWLVILPSGGATPTPTPTRTNTPLPTNTPTSTNTPVPPSPTNTAQPSATTPAGSATPTNTVIATSTAEATSTATVPAGSPTPTVCTISFSDVPTTHPFYPYIRCLACRGILGGYSDGTFRPDNSVTRGQLSKIVANAAGFSEPVSGQTFSDVPPSHPFYVYIERMAGRGIIGGYSDGTFRPDNNATRGQISKIVANAAGIQDPIPQSRQTFSDVPPTHPFWVYIERLAGRGILGGYSDGTFRPDNNATRGQTAKIVSNAFFPECSP